MILGDATALHFRTTRLLGIGVERSLLARLSEAASFHGVHLHVTPNLRAALTALADHRFDALVVPYRCPDDSTRCLLGALRAPGSPARAVPILLLAPGEHAGLASDLLRCGATRVVDVERAPFLLHLVLREVLHVARRFAARTEVRLGPAASAPELRVEGGWPASLARTVNVSSTGMLIATVRRADPGAVLPFELIMPADESPLRGWAEVVRIARAPVDSDDGLGVRITALANDGRQRYEAFLDRLGA